MQRTTGITMSRILVFSPVFAALTSILAKVGIEGVDSNLGTAIRTLVVFFMAVGMVHLTGAKVSLAEISTKTWVFLVLSGLATGASWLCYFKALQLGDVSKVAPLDKLSVPLAMLLGVLVLGEPCDPKTVAGGILITAGALLLVL